MGNRDAKSYDRAQQLQNLEKVNLSIGVEKDKIWQSRYEDREILTLHPFWASPTLLPITW